MHKVYEFRGSTHSSFLQRDNELSKGKVGGLTTC